MKIEHTIPYDYNGNLIFKKNERNNVFGINLVNMT